MLDWNDLRYFLAVARTGTTLAASRDLCVSQSTVSRRIAALEEALCLTLFDKRPAGYALTEAGSELMESARGLEAAAGIVASRASALARGLTGTVRLTTNELFATAFLMAAMRDFRTAYPAIRLEIVTSDRHLDLGAGEADVALRATRRPEQGALVGRRIAADAWAVYCSRAYAAAHGAPTAVGDLAAHAFVGADESAYGGPVIEWALAHVPPASITMRPSSVNGMFAAIRNGLGVGLLPEFVAGSDPDLVRCFAIETDQPYEVWLLTHERRRNVPAVRAVLDYLSGYFASGLHRPKEAVQG